MSYHSKRLHSSILQACLVAALMLCSPAVAGDATADAHAAAMPRTLQTAAPKASP